MAKLKREALAHYLDSTFGAGAAPSWFRLGKDLEDFSIELNPDTSTQKNILGETSVTDNGYTPSATADPYYANPADAIYESIRDIAFNRKKNDDCKTTYLEVIVEDAEATSHKAWIEDVIIKPQSYGGDTSGVHIPFQILFDGNRKEGTVTFTDGVPTFTKKA